MYTKKFAIMNVIGNDKIILKTFAPDEKEQAIAYGEEIIKRDFTGVIVRAIIRADENGDKAGNSAQVFRVWEQEDSETALRIEEVWERIIDVKKVFRELYHQKSA